MSCDHPRTYRGHCVVCRAQNVARACDGAHWFDINGYCTKCGASQEPSLDCLVGNDLLDTYGYVTSQRTQCDKENRRAEAMTLTSAKWGFEVEPMCEPKDAALRESMREARMLPAINVTFQSVEADRMMKEYAAFIDSMIAEAIARIEAKGEIVLTENSAAPPPPAVMVVCKACPTIFTATKNQLWCMRCEEKRATIEAGPGISAKK